MKKTKIAVVLTILLMAVAVGTSARKVPAPKMYIFGFAASFNDTIVHFTDIQTLDSAWIDTRFDFLEDRSVYSQQLRAFLEAQDMPHRTCMVFYSTNPKKLAKKLLKMKRLYAQPKEGQRRYDVRRAEGFRFTSVKPILDDE